MIQLDRCFVMQVTASASNKDLPSCSNDISSGWVRGKQGGRERMRSSKKSLPVQTPPLSMQVLIAPRIILFCKVCVLSRSKSSHSMQICIIVQHLAPISK